MIKRRRLCKQRPYADEYDDPLLDDNVIIKVSSIVKLRPASMKAYAIAATDTLKIDAAVHFMLTSGRAHMTANAANAVSAYTYLCCGDFYVVPQRRFR